MWYREYQDTKNDEPVKRNTLESGKGIKGCEMQEHCGWGLDYHKPKRKPGMLRALLSLFSRSQ